jgi:hypothetical protein
MVRVENMGYQVTYRNRLSRLLLKPAFEWQFIIPLRKPPPLAVRFFEWYEENVLRVDVSDIEIDRPIFLVGVPRSGTTMLQDILCAHPQVAYFTNAMHMYPTCLCAVEDLRKRFRLDFSGERFLQDGIRVGTGTPNEGHAFFARWLDRDPYALDGVKVHFNDLSEAQKEAMGRTIRKVLWSFGGQGKRFFNKNPNSLFYLPLMQEAFPDARIIHIVRDARQVANSMLKLYARTQAQLARIPRQDDRPFIPYPRYANLRHYVETYGAEDLRTTSHIWRDAMAFVDSCRGDLTHFYEVRYEDILADPRGEIERLLAFCELPPVTEPDAPFWQKVNGVGAVSHTNQYGNFDLIESICGEYLTRYGYPLPVEVEQ